MTAISQKRAASLAGLGLNLKALEKLSAKERAAAEAELLEVERLFKRNPLLGLRYHAKQVKISQPPFPPLRAFFGGNRCLAAGTLVRMADGSARPIELVEPGDWVFGCNPEGDTRPVRVLHRFDNGPREVSRYWFGKRREELLIDATGDHQLSGVHEKYGPKVTSLHRMTGWPTTRVRWSVRRSLGWDLPEGEDEDLAMLLGLLLGDGCLTGNTVQFTSADDDITELFRSELETVECGMSANCGNPIQFIATRSIVLRARLRELGACCYAHEKVIPSVCWSWSTPAIERLVAGLLLTDGSVWRATEGWRVGFTSTSRPLADGLRRLLAERLGVYGSTLLTNRRPDKNRPEYSFTIGNYAALERLLRIPLVGRKQALLEEAVATWEGKRSDASVLRFRCKESLGTLPTHDLHVDHEDHLFVLANGLIVHNSGKTTWGAVDTLVQAIPAGFVPDHLLSFKRWEPPFFCRVVTPDLGHTMELVLAKLRKYCPAELLRGGRFDKAWDKQLRTLHFDAEVGSWIQFNSSDQDLDKLGGEALHRVWYDEEPREDIRGECIWRLVDFDGEEIFTMTPTSGMTFMFDEVYDPWERGVLPAEDGRVVVVHIDENPYLSDTGRERAKKKAESKPLEREARTSGRFVSFAGLIYPEFSSLKHVVPDEDEIPDGVECFEGIDPGIRHLSAVLFCYLDSQDGLEVYDEIALQGKTISQVCKEIHKKRLYWKVTPRWSVIDPAARNKNAQTGRSDQQEYADHGVFTIPGQNAVRPGINRVKERLEAENRLRVARRCEELRSEFRRYRWAKNSRTEDEPRERPVKRDDHCLDVLRLICMQRPLVPRDAIPEESLTMKARLLRHHLKSLNRSRMPAHDSGPGIWA